MIVAQLNIRLLLKKDIVVLAVLVQRVDHLMKQRVVELGVRQDHLVAQTDAVGHIALQRTGKVRSLSGIGTKGIIGELSVVDLGHHIFLPVKQHHRHCQQHKKEDNHSDL